MDVGRLVRLAIVAVAFVALVVLLNGLSQALVQPDPAAAIVAHDEAVARQPQISAVADTADKAISMLFSLQLGLTVLVGFVLQQMSTSDRRSWPTHALGGLFLLATTVGISEVSGLNTELAKIEGEVTREDAIAACDQGTGSYTEECVTKRLAEGPLHMAATANCVSGIFSNLYGEKHQFLGVNSGKYATSEKFALMNLATGEVANGSMASGYPVNLDIFAALCPEYVPVR